MTASSSSSSSNMHGLTKGVLDGCFGPADLFGIVKPYLVEFYVLNLLWGELWKFELCFDNTFLLEL